MLCIYNNRMFSLKANDLILAKKEEKEKCSIYLMKILLTVRKLMQLTKNWVDENEETRQGNAEVILENLFSFALTCDLDVTDLY